MTPWPSPQPAVAALAPGPHLTVISARADAGVLTVVFNGGSRFRPGVFGVRIPGVLEGRRQSGLRLPVAAEIELLRRYWSSEPTGPDEDGICWL